MIAAALSAALAIGVLASGASAHGARGTYCGTIRVHTQRHTALETWKVYRQRGTCAKARAAMAAYQSSVYRTAKNGNCTDNTCSNAPAPAGLSCGSGTAGQEITTGYLSTCRGEGAVYRTYEDHGYAES